MYCQLQYSAGSFTVNFWLLQSAWMSARAAATEKGSQRRKSIPELLVQAFGNNEDKDWDTDEVLDSVYWLRQLLAVVCGVIWGAAPLTGLIAFLAFVAVVFGGIAIWTGRQGIDTDLHGGGNAVYNEGVGPALALFVLTWVTTYTALHS